jgi:hypothetical protein
VPSQPFSVSLPKDSRQVGLNKLSLTVLTMGPRVSLEVRLCGK